MIRRALVIVLAFMLITSTVSLAHVGLTAATNQYRLTNGLTTLTSSSILDSMAAQRATEIVNNFSHSYWWADQICWQAAGENLAYTHDAFIQQFGFSSAAEYFVYRQWANSPTHNANMLGDFNEIGTAIYSPGNGYHYAVQIFIKSCGSGGNTSNPSTSTPPPSGKSQAVIPKPTAAGTPIGAKTGEPVTLPDTSTGTKP